MWYDAKCGLYRENGFKCPKGHAVRRVDPLVTIANHLFQIEGLLIAQAQRKEE